MKFLREMILAIGHKYFCSRCSDTQSTTSSVLLACITSLEFLQDLCVWLGITSKTLVCCNSPTIKFRSCLNKEEWCASLTVGTLLFSSKFFSTVFKIPKAFPLCTSLVLLE